MVSLIISKSTSWNSVYSQIHLCTCVYKHFSLEGFTLIFEHEMKIKNKGEKNQEFPFGVKLLLQSIIMSLLKVHLLINPGLSKNDFLLKVQDTF